MLINVPATLDMYEARLYLMAAPSIGVGTTLIDDPLADESCLYGGIREGIFGGYNLKAPSVRFPDRVASCEFAGEDMMINYTAPFPGEILYHLVFIAEDGAGDLSFMIKTDYDPPRISLFRPSDIGLPGEATVVQAKV